jgi:predicted transcriptional regulator
MYIGDLLSWVMGRAKQGSAWVTIQGHVNIVAVAELKEVACVIVAEDAEIAQDTADKADAEGIPLLRTERDAFSVAKAFCALG